MRLAWCLCAAAMLTACSADLKEGHYACSRERGCPDGWFCVGNRCFSRPGDAGPFFDAGPFDAGPARDAGRDAGSDAGPDFDGGPPLPDAGSDAGPCCVDDRNPCTDQACPAGTCVESAVTDGVVCEAAGRATCQARVCTCDVGAMRCAPGAPCVDTNTDPANCGVCGRVCAMGETCSVGVCGTCSGMGDCDDSNACTTDACNMATDMCTHTGACGASEFCMGASCRHCGLRDEPCCPPATCTDGSRCFGSVCVECVDSGDCNDGMVCNGVEQCTGSNCMPGTAVTCGVGSRCDEAMSGCCGAESEVCCSMSPRCEAPGTTCAGFTCMPCGDTGERCCGGTGCNAGLACCSAMCATPPCV